VFVAVLTHRRRRAVAQAIAQLREQAARRGHFGWRRMRQRWHALNTPLDADPDAR
jgi:hypothetical protein